VATLKEIKSRMSSVKGIEQVTRAMKMVATVKLRRAQAAIIQARPYAYRIRDLLNNLIPQVESELNPLLAIREPRKFCTVVVTSDRGLCGSFNTNVLHKAEPSMTVFPILSIIPPIIDGSTFESRTTSFSNFSSRLFFILETISLSIQYFILQFESLAVEQIGYVGDQLLLLVIDQRLHKFR